MSRLEQPTPEQALAINRFFHHPVSVITGGPGSGKTTVVKFLELPGKRHLICAPTGCAASRIHNATRREAHVISKIEYSAALIEEYKGCVLIVDEASMVGIGVCVRLFASLQPQKLVVIGDARQLTCIGENPLLNTLLQCGGVLPITCLTQNLRQRNAESGLAKTLRTLGTREWKGPVQDCSLRFKLYASDNEAIMAAAMDFDKATQMLAFSNDVCNQLNHATQNKQVPRVVCIENAYVDSKLFVANGITGVMNSNGDVVYNNGAIDKKRRNGSHSTRFKDARCITVHKAQGSEFSVKGIVVITPWKGKLPLELDSPDSKNLLLCMEGKL